MTIATRHLRIGLDRLCVKCGGVGAFVPASASTPARPARPAELRAARVGRPGPVRKCGRCDGSGIEPGSRVLREVDRPEDAWPSLPDDDGGEATRE